MKGRTNELNRTESVALSGGEDVAGRVGPTELRVDFEGGIEGEISAIGLKFCGRKLAGDFKALFLAPAVVGEEVGSREDVPWPNQLAASEFVKLERNDDLRGKDAMTGHARGEFKSGRSCIKDLEHVNSVAKLRNFVER
jgi:hypothetical protein